MIPLSLWGKKDAVLPASRDVWQPFDPKTHPLAEWRTMNRAMTESPPEARLGLAGDRAHRYAQGF
jgi:hypothetical protein